MSSITNNLTLNGATLNGVSEMRTSAASNVVVGGTAASNISANVDLLNNTGNFNVGVTGDPNADLNISGTVLGPSTLNKSGLGTMALTGNNTNTGAVNINAGTLLADNGSSTASSTGTGVSHGGGRWHVGWPRLRHHHQSKHHDQRHLDR